MSSESAAGIASTLGNRLLRRGARGGDGRDALADTLPLISSMSVAWWTTVRPAGFSFAATFGSKVAASAALLGCFGAAFAVSRRVPRVWLVVASAFILPSTLAWLLGPPGATALLDPIELAVGALSWTLLGIVLQRPQAVAIPKGSEGGLGPTIGATDDAARVAMRELDALLTVAEPAPVLAPRKPTPRLASAPRVVAAMACALVVYQSLRVATGNPDRAILARAASTGVTLALLGVAGDLVEARYQVRAPASPRARLQRAAVAIAGFVVLAFIGWVTMQRDE